MFRKFVQLLSLGRITIPKEMRNDMGLKEGDMIIARYDDEKKTVTLSKAEF